MITFKGNRADNKRYDTKVEFSFLADGYSAPRGFLLFDNNGCCADDVVILYETKHSDSSTYSCVCSCGGWCTSGHGKMLDAIREYEQMCQRVIEHRKGNGKVR